jgi:tetratricopeptide (TPR) repeat protein
MEMTETETLYCKAQRYFVKKKYNMALKVWGKISEFKVNDENMMDIVDSYYLRATIYARKRDFDAAIADYTKAAELRKWSRDYEGIALMYQEKGDLDRAIAYFTKGIRVGKRCCEGYDSYFFRGKIYLEHKKNYDKAISDFKNSIKRCGSKDTCEGCADAYYYISKAYKAKSEEVRENYRQLMAKWKAEKIENKRQ